MQAKSEYTHTKKIPACAAPLKELYTAGERSSPARPATPAQQSPPPRQGGRDLLLLSRRSPPPRVRKCSHIPWASRPHQICEDPSRGMAVVRHPLPFTSSPDLPEEPRTRSVKSGVSTSRVARDQDTLSCSRADRLYPTCQLPALLFSPRVMAPQDVSASGYVLRKVQRDDKWVRRWLQVSQAGSFTAGAPFTPVYLGTERPRRHTTAHRQSNARPQRLRAWSSSVSSSSPTAESGR